MRFLRGDRGVALDEFGENAALRLNAQRERGDIQQQHAVQTFFLVEHATLNGGTDGYHFVGVYSLIGLFAKQRFGGVNHAGHAGHPANQHKFVDVAAVQTGVLQAFLHRTGGAFKEIVGELFQLSASELALDVFGAGLIGCDERQAYLVCL